MSTLTPWRRPVRSRQRLLAASAAAAMVACAAASTANDEGSTGAVPVSSIAPGVASGWAGGAQQSGKDSLWIWCAHSTAAMTGQGRRMDGSQGWKMDAPEMPAQMLPIGNGVANGIYARVSAWGAWRIRRGDGAASLLVMAKPIAAL